MIRHIVLFRVFPDTSRERIQHSVERLEALVGVVPGLRSLRAGIDLGLDPNYDFGLVALLEDRAALESFSSDPEHVSVAMEILTFRKDTDIAILDFEE